MSNPISVHQDLFDALADKHRAHCEKQGHDWHRGAIQSFVDFAKQYLEKYPPAHFVTGPQFVVVLANAEEFAVGGMRTTGPQTEGGMEDHTVVPVFGNQSGKRTQAGG